jgi:hypothetical protein
MYERPYLDPNSDRPGPPRVLLSKDSAEPFLRQLRHHGYNGEIIDAPLRVKAGGEVPEDISIVTITEGTDQEIKDFIDENYPASPN